MMKNNKFLITIFIFLLLSVLLSFSACGYFRDKSGLSDANADNTVETGANADSTSENGSTSENNSGTADASKETTSSQYASDSTEKNLGSDYEENTASGNVSQKYAIIASGSSYDSRHYKWFLNSTDIAYKVLKNSGFTEENIYYLFENPKESNVDYQSTIDNFRKITNELQAKAVETDTIVLFLIGHGSYDGTNSYYALSGYNLSDTAMAAMFKNIKRDKLIFVFSPCNSGGFVDDLSGKNTLVITSTRKNETNSAAFIEPFLVSFDGTGDADSDGKVSFAEAFNYASINVRDQYINNSWGSLTEHAQLDDNGDGMSNEASVPAGGDGFLARDIYLK